MVGENPLGWLLPDPSCKKQSQGALLKGDMGPNEYPLYQVYIWGWHGLTSKGTIPRGPHHFPSKSLTVKGVFFSLINSNLTAPAFYTNMLTSDGQCFVDDDFWWTCKVEREILVCWRLRISISKPMSFSSDDSGCPTEFGGNRGW